MLKYVILMFVLFAAFGWLYLLPAITSHGQDNLPGSVIAVFVIGTLAIFGLCMWGLPLIFGRK